MDASSESTEFKDAKESKESKESKDGKESSPPKEDSCGRQHFDAVVMEDRKRRQLSFGPNSIKVIKPSNILIDIYGVICSWAFAKTLKEYATANMAKYLKENWKEKVVREAVAAIRSQLKKEQSQQGAGSTSGPPQMAGEEAPEGEQVETAVTSILWLMGKKHKSTAAPISRLSNDLWSKAYDSGQLKTHAYPDVTEAFQYWRFEEFIKIYSYASGCTEGQRQFLRSSVQGDLNRFIANALNASGGFKMKTDKFRQVASALREPNLKNLLYISDCPKKATSAIQAGIRALVVNRDNSSTGKYSPSETANLQVVVNLSDIQFIDDPQATVTSCC